MKCVWQTPQQMCARAPDMLIGFSVAPDSVTSAESQAGTTGSDPSRTPFARLSWLAPFAPLAQDGAYPPLTGLAGLDDVHGTRDELVLLHPEGWSVQRIVLAGLGALEGETSQVGSPAGRADSESGGSWSGRHVVPGCLEDRLRRAAGAAMVRARELRLTRVALALDAISDLAAHSGRDPLRLVHEAIYGVYVGLYRYTAMKTDHTLLPDPTELILVGAPPLPDSMPGLLETAALAQAEAEAVCLARDLVNTPSNRLTPTDFAQAARQAATNVPLTCSVLGRGQLESAGMGALLAVARGSTHDPALICLEYAPSGHEQDHPLILIGKGVTFDSGGISLKPAAGMQDMKGDMAGAAAVLAAMTILARTGGARRVIGLMPCVENMPDALATRPGDVVTTLKGTTVEIINTDAEGRLVLCDALTYAQARWQPDAIVDVATLTGACVVALGPDVAGVFGTDDVLVERIVRLGAARGEWFWRMPLWDCYLDNLKSQTADVANSGSREGGAASAAIFLRQFVEQGVHWAHLDIAGPSYTGSRTPGRPAGGTGFAVRTLAALGR